MRKGSARGPIGRPPKQENQRQRILDRAAEIIAVVGYEKTSLGDIAKELGLTRQAIYHYFPTKQDIFNEIVLTIVKEMYEHVLSSVNQKDSYAAQLRCVMIAHASYFDSKYWMNVAGSTGYGGISRRDLTRIDEIEHYRSLYKKLLSRILRRGIQNGEFRKVNIKSAVRVIYQLLNIMRWYRPDGTKRATDFAAENYEIICAGLISPAVR